MTQKMIYVWGWITVIMLALLAVMFIFNSGAVLPLGSTVEELARLLGLKNAVYAGLLLYALTRKSRQLLVVLLLGRGIMDMLDGGVSVATGNMAPPYIAALVTGVITLVAGYKLSQLSQTDEK